MQPARHGYTLATIACSSATLRGAAMSRTAPLDIESVAPEARHGRRFVPGSNGE